MHPESLFMSVISKNKQLHDIINKIKQHYCEERMKLYHELIKLKERCKIDWLIYIKKNNLPSKFGVDIMILELKIRELDLRLRKVENTIRLTCKLSLIGTFQFKKIVNKKKIQLEKEVCSICCETHIIKKLFTTKCGHHFGECCFGKYIEHKIENKSVIKCPLCRSNNILPVVKYY
jgi:hypothetical protein